MKGCAKFLAYGFGALVALSILSSICRGCAGPSQPQATRQAATVERPAAGVTSRATATRTPRPTPTATPAVTFPILVKAQSGWQFQISEVRTLKAVETDS